MSKFIISPPKKLKINQFLTGDPIPVPLGSPQGPNQWFYGAPVVLARIPA
jgi:hypothetical protein